MKPNHHPSYAADRKYFCFELARMRLTYARVALYLQDRGWKRPAEGDVVYRRHILKAVQSNDWIATLWQLERDLLDQAEIMGVPLAA